MMATYRAGTDCFAGGGRGGVGGGRGAPRGGRGGRGGARGGGRPGQSGGAKVIIVSQLLHRRLLREAVANLLF